MILERRKGLINTRKLPEYAYALLKGDIPATNFRRMSLTRIDCSLSTGSVQGGASYSLLNPAKQPGCLVSSYVEAARAGLGSQVACAVSIEAFTTAILSPELELCQPVEFAHDAGQLTLELETQADRNLKILEFAFRSANLSAYEFGHKLSAGGRLAANMLSMVIKDDVLAVGRVGSGEVYLSRQNRVFPFFEGNNNGNGVNNYIGSNSIVNVELASIPITEGDRVVMSSKRLVAEALIVIEHELHRDFCIQSADALVERLYPTSGSIPFLMVAYIGPKAIYLGNPLDSDLG